MASEQYVIIPGTQQRVFEGSVVMLHRLPNLRWILHWGYYNYNGSKTKGWYFSSIPADTTMPVFVEDLVAMTVIDGSDDPFRPGPHPPCPPIPPPRPMPPGPPAPIPIPFTPQDKAKLDAAMFTVDGLEARDKLSDDSLQDGLIVRVNDIDGKGTIEYYSWDSASSSWVEASLGYRYMTKDEITEAISADIVSIVWSNESGSLVVTNNAGQSTPVELEGVAHDPTYIKEELTLRIPVYGHEDIVVTIPPDNYIRSLRFDPEYKFEDGKIGPAIVVIVSDGVTEQEIAGDASGLYNIYTGGDTESTEVIVDKDSGIITTNVNLSKLAENRLTLTKDGLLVDISELEETVDELVKRTNIGDGDSGEIVVTTEDGIQRSIYSIGDSELSEDDDKLLATEEAVKAALSWRLV